MNKEQKAAVVAEIAGQLSDAEAVFAVDYRGLTVPQAAELRVRLRDADARLRIVKNRLTKRAVEAAGTDAIRDALDEGPTALTFVKGDPALAAKALATFGRQHGILEFKAGLMEGATLDPEEFKTIARLPARDVLHGQFIGVLASPITGLTRGLASMLSGLAIQLKQIEEQGLVEGETEESPAEPDQTETEESPPGGTGSEAEETETDPDGSGREAEQGPEQATADETEPGGTGSEAEETETDPDGSGREAEQPSGNEKES
jgi:large subunit ribosomal protein L10